MDQVFLEFKCHPQFHFDSLQKQKYQIGSYQAPLVPYMMCYHFREVGILIQGYDLVLKAYPSQFDFPILAIQINLVVHDIA